MKNGDEKAFPLPARQYHNGHTVTWASDTPGLTKREYFAAMAMQGYIAAGGNGMPTAESLAKYATDAADALIVELDKPAQ